MSMYMCVSFMQWTGLYRHTDDLVGIYRWHIISCQARMVLHTHVQTSVEDMLCIVGRILQIVCQSLSIPAICSVVLVRVH